MNIAVLASTRGTDLQAIIDAINAGELTGVDLKVVMSNKADCYALERAKEQGFKTVFVDPRNADGSKREREDFDQEMTDVLKQEGVELVVLVGFMRILSEQFVREFAGKIINVHPALIPKFSGEGFFGANVHQAVLDAGETETGMTIHLVDEGCDTGPIVIQKTVMIEEDDTVETLKEKVQGLEKKWYPWVIQQFADGKVKVSDGEVTIE